MSKLVVITGGSRGLGHALVEAYAADGWRVLELSRSVYAGRADVESVRLDLADPEAASSRVTELLAERITPELTHVHFISNAAALAPVGFARTTREVGWRTHLDVNVASGIGVMSAFLAQVDSHPAHKLLVNISSGAATKAVRGWSLYCASKAALEHWIRVVALEEASGDHPTVAINVAPGVVDTEMQQTIRSSSVADFPDHARFVELKESGTLRAPADVAKDLLELVEQPLETGASYRL